VKVDRIFGSMNIRYSKACETCQDNPVTVL